MASAFFPLSRALPQVVFFLVSAYFETELRKQQNNKQTKAHIHTPCKIPYCCGFVKAFEQDSRCQRISRDQRFVERRK